MGRFATLKKLPVLGKICFAGYMKVQGWKKHYDNVNRCKNFQIPNGNGRIFYLDVPIHSNLGDNAQYLCIRQWLAENYPERDIVEIDGLFLSDLKCGIIERLKKVINMNDIIFFQSGYCTQDIGGYHDLVHRVIVENFPDIPIVMLPQTVYYQDYDNAKKTAECYAKHKKIFFMARDFTSAKLAQTLFTNIPVYTYPDIVTTWIGTRKTKAVKREGILFCIRDDSEKYYSETEIMKLYSSLGKIAPVSMCDTTINIRFNVMKERMWEYIDSMINQFQKTKVVITDRYHGTIFSLVAGTPVIVIKTTDHKVRTGVEWFNGVYDDYVFYVESLEEADKLARRLYEEEFCYQLSNHFKENYYDCLREKIDVWRAGLE